MRVLMAVSKDGYMARERDDRMGWLGATDKAVFRVLSGVGGVMAAGSRTTALMPGTPGRRLLALSRSGYTLADLATEHPDAWLLGGPALALEALASDWAGVDEVHLCRSDRLAFPDPLCAGSIRDTLTPYLEGRGVPTDADNGWRLGLKTRVLDVTVERWGRVKDA